MTEKLTPAKRTITYTNTTKKLETIYSMHEACKKKVDDVPNVCETKKINAGGSVSFAFPSKEECYLVKVVTKGYNLMLLLSEERDTYTSEDF